SFPVNLHITEDTPPPTSATKSGHSPATLVNWLPCSLLKISGRPKRASASSSASRQNDTSMLFDSRHASTARLAQSIIATRYRNPRCLTGPRTTHTRQGKRGHHGAPDQNSPAFTHEVTMHPKEYNQLRKASGTQPGKVKRVPGCETSGPLMVGVRGSD